MVFGRRGSCYFADAIMHGMPPHIAQLVAGHRDIGVTLGYKAVYLPRRSHPAAPRPRPATTANRNPRQPDHPHQRSPARRLDRRNRGPAGSASPPPTRNSPRWTRSLPAAALPPSTWECPATHLPSAPAAITALDTSDLPCSGGEQRMLRRALPADRQPPRRQESRRRRRPVHPDHRLAPALRPRRALHRPRPRLLRPAHQPRIPAWRTSTVPTARWWSSPAST